jgi:hypothetical protein
MLEIREIDSIVLKDVTDPDGAIYVIAGGEITAVLAASKKRLHRSWSTG